MHGHREVPWREGRGVMDDAKVRQKSEYSAESGSCFRLSSKLINDFSVLIAGKKKQSVTNE